VDTRISLTPRPTDEVPAAPCAACGHLRTALLYSQGTILAWILLALTGAVQSPNPGFRATVFVGGLLVGVMALCQLWRLLTLFSED
jgi:hypothetical protein